MVDQNFPEKQNSDLPDNVLKTGLTKKEIEVCFLIRNGYGDQEIAMDMCISVHTVKNHVKRIHKKLEVHTRGQLAAFLNGRSLFRISP